MKNKTFAWTWNGGNQPLDLIKKEVVLRNLEEGEILIANSYIGLNPVDWKLLNGGGNPSWQENHIPGVDGAGIVVAVHPSMQRIPIGARVCYHADLTQNGSFATHTIVKGNRIMFAPNSLSDLAAAAFPCPNLTAWQALKKIPEVKGMNILVNGAGGSVGYFLTQLLLQQGAKVFVTASSKHHVDFYNLGVQFAVDYKIESFKNILLQQLQSNHFDVMFDTVSGQSAANLADLLGYYGHIVSIQDRISANPLPAFTTAISMHEISLGAFHKYATKKQISILMQEGTLLMNQIGNGQLVQRNIQVSEFNYLNEVLQELKDNPSDIKHVIKV